MGVEYRYLDIIWLDNLVMNFILLWAVSKVFKEKPSLWRLLTSSSLGALYAVLLICGFNILNNMIFKLVLSLSMVLIGYRHTSFSRFLKLLGLFYGLTFALGGAAFGVYFFMEGIAYTKDGVFYLRNFPVKVIFMSSFLIIILINTIWPKVKLRILTSNFIYSINIKHGDKDFIFDGLLDTGNLLYDPLSQAPIVIVEYKMIQDGLPEGIKDIYTNGRQGDMVYVKRHILSSGLSGDFSIIPFHSVGTMEDFLIGFKPKQLFISFRGHWLENRSTLIAIYNSELSKDKEYHALIHPELLPACQSKG